MGIEIAVNWSLVASIVIALVVFELLRVAFQYVVWDRRKGHLGIAVDVLSGSLVAMCETLERIEGRLDDVKRAVEDHRSCQL